jgi:hypothetical protein
MRKNIICHSSFFLYVDLNYRIRKGERSKDKKKITLRESYDCQIHEYIFSYDGACSSSYEYSRRKISIIHSTKKSVQYE